MYFKTLLLVAGIHSAMTACHKKTRTDIARSGIEKIFVDSGIVRELESGNYTKVTPPRDSLLQQTIYIAHGGIMSGISRDSLNRIRRMEYINSHNDSLTISYFPNGQAEYKKIFAVRPGTDSVVGFYPDGRIWSTGLQEHRGRKLIGKWKFYDSLGDFVMFGHFSDDGKIISDEEP